MRCLAVLEAVILLLNAPEKKQEAKLKLSWRPAFVTERKFLVVVCQQIVNGMHWSNYSDVMTSIRGYVS